jgi:hypothetical protein
MGVGGDVVERANKYMDKRARGEAQDQKAFEKRHEELKKER